MLGRTHGRTDGRRTVGRRAATVGVAGLAMALAAAPASASSAATNQPVDEPSEFTSAFMADATPDMVVPDPGEPDATGSFMLRVNSDEEIVCYDIELRGVTPPYESPAVTATHVHEAPQGEAGPPRLAFPNPEDDGDGTLRSSGCLQGPFETGIVPDGADEDSGAGFSLAQLEADPAAFFADTHTSQFPAGAVRGQLREVPLGGVDTGVGDPTTAVNLTAVGAGALALTAASGALVLLRRRSTTS